MPDQSLAEKTQVMMREYKIPATPDNYRVWYTYFEGSNQSLNQAIDELRDKGATFDQATNNKLYHHHFGDDAFTKVESECVELERVIDDASAGMNSASQSLGEYRDLLNTAGTELKSASSAALESLIDKLAESTKVTSEEASEVANLLGNLLHDVANIKQKMVKLSEEAYKDPLTSIGNRRYFDTRFSETMLLARNRGYGFSLLVIDIDDFKTFNDTHGHKVGDLVLRFVGKLIEQSSRSGDIAARYGGEEFVVLLPDTSSENAKIFANNLRRKICAQELTLHNKNIGKVSVSVGVAEFRSNDTEDSLFERADNGLYKAKSQGKNCVVIQR